MPDQKRRFKVEKENMGRINCHQIIDSYNFIELLIQSGTYEAIAPEPKQ